VTVFLTPDGEPFFGGTYFPPEPRHGLPSFRQVLLAVAERGATGATTRCAPVATSRRARPLGDEAAAVTGAAHRCAARRGTAQRRARLRSEVGRLEPAPKFPPGPLLEF
jgi:uncharacterized protein YyaL (SSP411 family)